MIFFAALTMHNSTVDGQRGVLGMRSPEVHNNLSCLLHVQGEIVVSALRGQMAHLTPVVCLIVVVDETHHSCVVRKLDDGVGVVQWHAVVSQQGEEEGAQHTSLGGPRVQGDSAGCAAADPHCLWSLCQEVQQPVAQGGVQS